MKTIPNVDDLLAGKQFRETLEHRADAFNGVYPLWHGWAILDAFLAGAEYARTAIGDGIVVPREPTDRMIGAALDDYERRKGKQTLSDQYRAMIDAAPQPGGDKP